MKHALWCWSYLQKLQQIITSITVSRSDDGAHPPTNKHRDDKKPWAHIRCSSHSFKLSWAERKTLPRCTFFLQGMIKASSSAQVWSRMLFLQRCLLPLTAGVSNSWYLRSSEANWSDVGRHHLKIHAMNSPGSRYKKPHSPPPSPPPSKQTSVKYPASILCGRAEICCCCKPCRSDVIYAFPMTGITLTNIKHLLLHTLGWWIMQWKAIAITVITSLMLSCIAK